MVKIKVDYKDDYVKEIKITGHAGYDEHGKDIVCASVSSIVITSANLILKVDKEKVSIKQEEGLIQIKVLKKDETINMILLNMIDMLEELSNDYKENVKII